MNGVNKINYHYNTTCIYEGILGITERDCSKCLLKSNCEDHLPKGVKKNPPLIKKRGKNGKNKL